MSYIAVKWNFQNRLSTVIGSESDRLILCQIGPKTHHWDKKDAAKCCRVTTPPSEEGEVRCAWHNYPFTSLFFAWCENPTNQSRLYDDVGMVPFLGGHFVVNRVWGDPPGNIPRDYPLVRLVVRDSVIIIVSLVVQQDTTVSCCTTQILIVLMYVPYFWFDFSEE